MRKHNQNTSNRKHNQNTGNEASLCNTLEQDLCYNDCQTQTKKVNEVLRSKNYGEPSE